jgi:hypothetical protein
MPISLMMFCVDGEIKLESVLKKVSGRALSGVFLSQEKVQRRAPANAVQISRVADY